MHRLRLRYALTATAGGAWLKYSVNCQRRVLGRRHAARIGPERAIHVPYDANGYLDLETDFADTVTDHDVNGRGLETQRIAAKSTSAQRTIQTDWHAAFHQPVERRVYNAASVLEAKTQWTYNARGQALTRSEIDPANSATRTTTYAYCEAADAPACPLVGLLKSVNGPRTDANDVTTYSYYTATDESGCAGASGECHHVGDLYRASNALGQSTTYLRYDRAGRPTRTQDANGVISDLEYSNRGWLARRLARGPDNSSESDDAITVIGYDFAGQVTRVTQPDGAFTSYTYDDAHRLTDIGDNLGDSIHYTLDAAGNRIKEGTKTYLPCGPLNVLTFGSGKMRDRALQLEIAGERIA